MYIYSFCARIYTLICTPPPLLSPLDCPHCSLVRNARFPPDAPATHQTLLIMTTLCNSQPRYPSLLPSGILPLIRSPPPVSPLRSLRPMSRP